jgi:hypothetical protein
MVRRFLVLAALLLAATAGFAGSDALSLVPSDAVTVGVVKINELRGSPLAAMVLEHTDRVSSDGEAAEFLAEAGLDPARDVDLLMVATSPKTRFGREAEVLVVANGRFNVERIANALVGRGAQRKDSYLTFSKEKDHTGAIAFPDSSTAIMGSEAAVIEALATRANGGSGWSAASALGHDAARIDSNASAWAIVDVTRASRFAGGARVPRRNDQAGEALHAAIRNVSTVALWATDTGDALKLGAFGLTSDGETLQLLEDTLRGALSAMRLAVKEKSPDLVSVLRRFTVEQTKDSVRITGTIPAESLRQIMAKHHARN